MHEIIPKVTKSVVQIGLKIVRSVNKIHVLKPQELRLLPQTCVPKSPLNLSRIHRSPRLAAQLHKAHVLIAYEPSRENNINTVAQLWKPESKRNASAVMKYWIQFLTTPTADTPGTTMYLHFDSKRYLIGHCAEGTQRAVVENKLGLTKMSDLLLTGKLNWDTAGGVLGMVLTLADSTATMRGSRRAMEEEKELRKQVQIAKGQKVMEPKVEKSEDVRPFLNIHGGENLTHLLATSRRFVFRKGMPVHTQEFTPKNTVLKEDCAPTWKDNLINVWAVALEPDFRRGRKRSHDEITQEDIDAEDIQNQQRKGVLADMFDSEWRLDTLVVKKLSQVELPAKIFVRDDKNKIVEYTGPPAKDVPVTEPDIDVLVRNPWPGALVAKLPSTTPSHTSVSYFIKGHTQRGKFDPAAATALGCERKQFRQLTAGEEVTTSIGTVVRPEQVMAPSQSGGGLAVFDLPDTSYVGPAIERKEWFSKDVMDGIGAVVWILGPGVVDDARLQTFMKERSELKHIVSSQETCPNNLSMHAAAEAAINLHLIDEERFPIPVHSNASTRKPSAIYDVARVGKTIQLAPAVEVNDDNIKPYLDTGKSVLDRDIEVADLAKEALGKITDAEYLEQLTRRQEDIPSRDAEVITLGTGSALPSKYRNVSATLLHVPGYGSYLFDCGENTLGQLKRVLGPELPDVLRDLKAIWISHLHADHHLGTAAVVKAWHKETQNDPSTKDNKLIIASDRDMLLWLQEYAEVDDYGYNRLNTIAFGGHEASDFRYRFSSKEEKTYGLSCIQSCYVKHCRSAMAVVFDFPNGFRVAYSGDCRPSDYFARIGEDATLLIHEATFDDELRTDALAKNHSTTSEAMTVGLNMNARRILLTHFSQRYQKIPVLGENNRDQVAIVAFDYMRCKIGDFAKVDAFRPALMKLYEEETGEIVKRKEKAKQAKPDED